MAKRKIVWSSVAQRKLFSILEFYAQRNRSKAYSAKLYLRFNKELKILHNQPDIGIKTDLDAVRGLIIDSYILFYEFSNDVLIVHTIWDCRQNPDSKIIK